MEVLAIPLVLAAVGSAELLRRRGFSIGHAITIAAIPFTMIAWSIGGPGIDTSEGYLLTHTQALALSFFGALVVMFAFMKRLEKLSAFMVLGVLMITWTGFMWAGKEVGLYEPKTTILEGAIKRAFTSEDGR